MKFRTIIKLDLVNFTCAQVLMLQISKHFAKLPFAKQSLVSSHEGFIKSFDVFGFGDRKYIAVPLKMTNGF